MKEALLSPFLSFSSFFSKKMVLGGGIENFELWFQNYVRIARVNRAIKRVSVWGTRQHWGGQVWSHASWHQTIKWDAEQILESFEPPANQCCFHGSRWSVTLVQIMVSLGDINKGIATINNNFIRFAFKVGLSGGKSITQKSTIPENIIWPTKTENVKAECNKSNITQWLHLC